jgi:hypothetical protein
LEKQTVHKTVGIDCSKIQTFEDFHAVFAEVMGFPISTVAFPIAHGHGSG